VRYLSYLEGQGFLELNGRRYGASDTGCKMLDEASQVIELLRGLRGDEAA
jgi:hypothetical protein